MISIQILIENETALVWGMPRENLIDFLLNFNWKLKDIGLGNLRQTLIEFYSNLNRTWKGIGLGNVWIESDWFPFRFQLKMKWHRCGQPKITLKGYLSGKIKGNWSEVCQDNIWLIVFYISTKTERKFVWQPEIESNWSLFKL